MAKAKKQKRAYTKRLPPVVSATSKNETFLVEELPPPPLRGASLEKLALLDKVDRTLPNVKPGQAFIIDAKDKNIVQSHLKRVCSSEQFLYMKVHDNPNAIRVYRLDTKKKK